MIISLRFVVAASLAALPACGLVNAFTTGDVSDPFAMPTCTADAVCDCFGDACACDADGCVCDDTSCVVVSLVNSNACRADGCACDVEGCTCVDGRDCECDEGEDATGCALLAAPGTGDPLPAATCEIADVCSCNGDNCRCNGDRCSCLGADCVVSPAADAQTSCTGIACICTVDHCTCVVGQQSCCDGPSCN